MSPAQKGSSSDDWGLNATAQPFVLAVKGSGEGHKCKDGAEAPQHEDVATSMDKADKPTVEVNPVTSA